MVTDLLRGFFFWTIDISRPSVIIVVELILGARMLTKEELHECSVVITVVWLIGNKRELFILRNLIYDGKRRFTDFTKTIPAISKAEIKLTI